MKRFNILKIVFMGVALTCAMLLAYHAQAQKANPSRANELSDEEWDAWRVGVTTYEEANTLFSAKEFTRAVALYEKSLNLFQSVQKSKPNWNKRGLKIRVEMVERKIAQAKKFVEAEKKNTSKNTGDKALEEMIANANAEATAEIANLKLQMELIQKQNVRYREQLAKTQETVKQVENLLREKEEMEKKYSLLLLQYNGLLEKGKNQRSETEVALQTAFETGKKQIADLEKQIQAGEKQRLEIQSVNAKLKEEIAKMQKQLALAEQKSATAQGMEKRILQLQESMLKIEREKKEAIQAKETELAQMRKDLAKKTRELEETNEALSKARNEMKMDNVTRQMEQEAARLKTENEMLQRQIASITDGKKDLEKKLAERERSLKQANELLQNLTAENKRLEADVRTAKENMKKMSEERKEVSERYQKSLAEMESIKKERDSFAEKLKQRPTEQTVKAQAQQEQQKIDMAKTTQQNEELLSELNKKREEVHSLLVKMNDLKELIRKQSETISKLEAAKTENNKKLEYFAKMKDEYDKQAGIAELLKSVQTENTVLKAELTALKKKDISAELQKELNRVKEEVKQYNNEYGRQREQLNALQRKNTELQTIHTTLKQQYDALLSENKTLKGDVKAINEWKNKMLTEEQQKELQNNLTEREKRISQLLKDIKGLNEKDAQYLRDIEVQRTRIETLEGKLDTAEKQTLAVQKKLAEAKKNDASHIVERNKALQRVQSLEKDLKELQSECVRFRQKIRDNDKASAEKLTVSQDKLAKAEQAIYNLKAENEALLLQIAAQKTKTVTPPPSAPKKTNVVTSTKDETTKDPLKDYQENKKQLDEAKNKIAALTGEFEKLERMLQKVRGELDVYKNAEKQTDEKKEKQIQDLESVKKELEKQIEDLGKEKTSASVKIVELQRNVKLLQTELDKWKSGATKMVQNELVEKDKVINQVLQENKEMAETIARMKSQSGKQNAEIAAGLKKIEKLTAEKQELERRLRLVPTQPKQTQVKNNATSSSAKEPTPVQGIRDKIVKAIKTPKEDTHPSAPEKKEAPKTTAEMIQKYTVLMNEAKAALDEKDEDTATWKYLQAAEANPFSPEPHLCLTKLYLQKKDMKSAEKHYRKALTKGATRDKKMESTLTEQGDK